MYEIKRRDPASMEPDLRLMSRIAETDLKFESSAVMRETRWYHLSSTPYNILKSRRFSVQGAAIWTIHELGDPVGLSGVYPHSEKVAVVGARTWIAPAHRTKSILGDLVFPIQEEFCRDYGYDTMIMTFTMTNQWLPKMIMRAASGKALQMGRKNSPFYTGWEELPGTHLIQNTEQTVLWKSLNGSGMPDLNISS